MDNNVELLMVKYISRERKYEIYSLTQEIKERFFIGLYLVIIFSSHVAHASLKEYKYLEGFGYKAVASNPVSVRSFGAGVSDKLTQEYFKKGVIDIDADLVGNELDNNVELELHNGDASTVTVAQIKGFGTEGNYSHVFIRGSNNRAFVGQIGNNNDVYLAQDGDDNVALIGQNGVNNTALVIQYGNENIAYVGQKNPDKFMSSKVSVNQSGDGHIAVVLAGSGADVGINQDSGVSSAILMDVAGTMQVHVNH